MKKNSRLQCNRRTALLGMTGAVASLFGCGGGADFAGLSSGGTGSFTSGTITGFGSIIVNGIRYNQDSARVVGSDDVAKSPSSLKVGMVVHVEGSALTPASNATGLPTATAYRIAYDSEWVGPVSNLATSTFELLGHTVDVLASTIIDGAVQQIADLRDTHFVEVFGYVDQVGGHLQASRVEVSDTPPTAYKLSGAISQINQFNRTAALGQTTVTWSGGEVLQSGVAEGSFVRVTLNPTPSAGVWTATRITLANSPLTSLSTDHDYEAEIHGSITDYQSLSNFVVSGIAVDAFQAEIVGTVALGVQVEVEGLIRSGQLVATKVSVKTVERVETQEFEFYGLISDVTAQTFVVRGETFYYDGSTANANLLTLSPLPYVQVKARRIDGRWLAIEIDHEN
jgi:hypothetical protein